MKIQSLAGRFIVLILIAIAPVVGFSQITSTAGTVIPTEYVNGPQDNIHVFCSLKGETKAALLASSANGVPGTFQWLKYNAATGSFDPFLSDLSNAPTSIISNLQDGGYRVIITTAAGTQTYTAWAFNNYIEITAAISAIDCYSLTLKGTSDTPAMVYYDLVSHQAKQVNKDTQVKWTANNETVAQFLEYKLFNPPTKDTEYTLTVSDRFGCSSSSKVMYESIVTKAKFSVDIEDQTKSHPTKTEAPLAVTFKNESENGDADKYEWFVYIGGVIPAKGTPQPKDSILTKMYVENPTYIFEHPGSYYVKLVSKKHSSYGTCTDTTFIDDIIKIDTSFIEAPNFFTPGNGDGINDQFIVRFFSMQTVKISIFNRWGKLMHVWESDNVKGFGPTIESIPQSVWDGKVGGRLAVPGVYYYVAEGRGRDGKMNKANGFFHLFRDK